MNQNILQIALPRIWEPVIVHVHSKMLKRRLK